MKEHLFKSQTSKFPIISRIITDTVLLSITLTFVLLFSTAVVGYQLFANIQKKQELLQKRQDLIKEQAFWQNIIQTYPNYPDAFISLGIISFSLRDFQSAKQYTDEALHLDPNSRQGRELEQALKKLGY